MNRDSIKISVTEAKEIRRRRRELLIAGGLLLLIVLLSLVEIKYLGVDFYLFMALFNINFIFLLIVLLLVVRNGVKLMLERRRKVLGSHLRSRLVLAFISLSLVPTALMYIVSTQFVQTSVEYWFKSQVETSMESALDVGQAFYNEAKEQLEREAQSILRIAAKQDLDIRGAGFARLLTEKYTEYDLVMIGLVSSDLRNIHWDWTRRFEVAWPEMMAKVDWNALRAGPEFWSSWWPGAGDDFVIGVMPVPLPSAGTDGPHGPAWNTGRDDSLVYLVLGERVGSGLLFKLDQIVRGVEEYRNLRTLKQPLKAALLYNMGMLTLLIVFGAMWFGFRLAKELTAPIQALAEGTERIAKGDLAVRLEDTSSDELGVLVRSFNRMAADLEQSRANLTEANLRMERQYLELERRGRYMAAVLENITAGVISVNEAGDISTMNKAAARMFGRPSNEFVGRKAVELAPEGYESMGEDIREFFNLNPNSQWRKQLSVPLKGGELRLLVNVVAITVPEEPGEQSQLLVAVIEDVTELEKMQRMAAWREVAKRIAHEIKNPLTPIKLSAQRLEHKFAKKVADPAFGECTGLIVRQVEQLQAMVSEFSSFAKLPELQPVKGDLMPLLDEVVALFEHSHSQIRWIREDAGVLPPLSFDREGLRRGLINILTNAVEVLDKQLDPAVIIRTAYDAQLNLVRLEFEDNGPGMSPEERSRLFEPYFSRKRGGTGLGLTILKSIISDHQGYVRVRSVQQQGTALIIELPVR